MNGVLPARIALIPELLERAAADWPDRTALVCGERRIDYRRYAAEVRAAARRLRQALPPGARVATLLGNSDLACVLTLALQMAGCQHVPLNPLYTARELDFILRDAQPALLIADEASSALAAPLAAAQGIRLLDGAAARAWTIPSDETPAAAPAGDADAPALLQYTGGTTGQPKGVILSRAAIATNVFQREAVLPTRHGAETVLCAMPLFHSYGMAMGLFGGQRRRHAGGAAALPARRCVRRRGARARHAVPRQPDDLCRPDGACALRADRLVQRARLLFGLRATGRGNAAALGGRGGRADL